MASTALDPNFMATLAEVSKPVEPARIMHEAFVKNWLPLIAKNDGSVPVKVWKELAGGYYNEIHVMKGDKLIYVIPPICTQIETIVDNSRGIGMDTVLNEAQSLQYISEERAAKLIETVFDRKFNISTDESALEALAVWDKIFEENGYKSMMTGAKGKVTNKTTPVYTEEDFDEL